MTPTLLEAWQNSDSQLKVIVLRALVDLWTPDGKRSSLGTIGPSKPPPRLPTHASEADLKKWEEEVRQLVRGATGHEDEGVRAAARRGAQRLGVVEGPDAD